MRPIAIICLLSFSSVALAQPTVSLPMASGGEDVVSLRDGTIYRGHVTELKPGDHLEIVLLDGRTQTVQWADIDKSVGPSFPEVKRNPAERFLKPAPGRVPVQVETAGKSLVVGVLQARPNIGQDSTTFDDGFNVSQLTANYQSSSGVVVCSTTPCQIYARPGLLKLQASGDDILSYSSEIVVANGGVHVKLRAPSVQGRALSTKLLIGALPAGIVGLLGVIFGASFTDPIFGKAMSPAMYGVGGTFLIVAVGLGIGSIAVWSRNRGGVVSVDPLNGALRF